MHAECHRSFGHQADGQHGRNCKSNGRKHGTEQDIYRTLQLIMPGGSDRAYSFRRKHEGCDHCAAELLRHTELLDAVVQWDSELFCHQNHADQIQEQHRRMKSH